MEPLLFIGFAVFALVAIILGIRADKQRMKELQAWAASRGLLLTPGNEPGFELEYPTFDCLRRGDDRYAFNVSRGEWNKRQVAAFDYHYKTESRDSKGRRHTHHHRFSAVIIKSGIPLKHMQIRSEGFFDKIGEFFGADDIDFESAEFSQKYHVKATEKKWAYDILHQRAIEFLLASPVYTLAMDTKSIIAYRSGRFAPAQFEEALNVASGLLDLIPEYVRREATQQRPVPAS